MYREYKVHNFNLLKDYPILTDSNVKMKKIGHEQQEHDINDRYD